MSSDWKKEFDVLFTYACFTWNGDNKTGVDCAKKVKRDLKAFISTLLLNQKKELREAIRTFEGSSPDWMDFEREEVLKIFDKV